MRAGDSQIGREMPGLRNPRRSARHQLSREDVAAVIQDATGGRGVDVVLDILGGTSLQRNLDALAPRGRLVATAFMEGPLGEINLATVAHKRALITGGFLRDLSLADKALLAQTVEARIWPWIAEGRYRPIVDSIFPLAQAAAAHRRMESSAHVGKIVLAAGAGAQTSLTPRASSP